MNNKIDGFNTYKQYACQQVINFQEPFKKLLKLSKPQLILEIGTGRGGFSIFLNDVMNELGLIYKHVTYDIHRYTDYIDQHNETVNNKIEFINKDVFSDLDYITSLINNYITTIVLCDGNDKTKEFNTFAPLIKEGNFIMGHDYAINREYFEKNIYEIKWNWLKLSGEDIQDTINNQHLKYFMNDEFNNIVWLCMQKFDFSKYKFVTLI